MTNFKKYLLISGYNWNTWLENTDNIEKKKVEVLRIIYRVAKE